MRRSQLGPCALCGKNLESAQVVARARVGLAFVNPCADGLWRTIGHRIGRTMQICTIGNPTPDDEVVELGAVEPANWIEFELCLGCWNTIGGLMPHKPHGQIAAVSEEDSRCRVCGCTSACPCPAQEHGVEQKSVPFCFRIEPDLCSECHYAALAKAQTAAGAS